MSMVDITRKTEVYRESTAKGHIRLKKETVKLIKDGKIEKGNPLDTAKIAGIVAAKNTSSLIPLCHTIPLTNVNLDVKIEDEYTITVEATVKTTAKTGVEMEALVATSIALLTIWDMTKKYEKDPDGQYPNTCIQNICVLKKLKRLN